MSQREFFVQPSRLTEEKAPAEPKRSANNEKIWIFMMSISAEWNESPWLDDVCLEDVNVHKNVPKICTKKYLRLRYGSLLHVEFI